MKKLSYIILFAILNLGVICAQSKVNSHKSNKNSKQLRIEEYKSISFQNFQFTSQDSEGYNITKNFTVDKAILIYEKDKFIGFILRSNGVAEAAFEVEKMMSEDSHGKQFWIDKSEKYFVVITFSSDKLDYRDMNIMFISNINGSILYNFSFDKILTEEEKRKQDEFIAQKIKEREKREERQKQAELKRQKEVNIILLALNKDVVEEKVHDYYVNKLLKDSEYWDVLERPKKEKNDTIVNVLVYVDSLNTNVVSIAGDVVDKELNDIYWKSSQHHYCTINGINYSKYQNSVFYSKKMSVKTKLLEKGIYGVEKKKDKFRYYKTVPNEIQEWCKDNIAKNGFHAIQYINYDGKYTIELINVTKEVRKMLQQKNL